MRKMFSVIAIALSCCAFGADKVVEWDATATPTTVADGTVGLGYDGQMVKSLVASNATPNSVTFKGDAMALAAGARICMGSGSLVFSNALNAAGNVGLTMELPKYVYGSYKRGVRDDAEFAYQISTPAKKVLDGMQLADVDVISGSLAGESCVSLENQGLVMKPYNVVRSDGIMTVQMQVNDGLWNKCVKLKFEQKGDGIYAESIYARFGTMSTHPFGNDFDKRYEGSQSIGSATKWGGYVVKGLTFIAAVTPEQMTFAKPFTAVGVVAITNTDVIVSGEGELGPASGEVAQLSLSSSSLVFSNLSASVLSFSRNIVGSSSSIVFSRSSDDGSTLTVDASFANALQNSSIVVGTNVVFNVNGKEVLANRYASTTLDVEAGGVVSLNVYNGELNSRTDITIHKGGILKQTQSRVLSSSRKVVLDGGLLAFSDKKLGNGGTWDSGEYLNNPIFRDGARTSGMSPRVGLQNATWTVSGTGAACSHPGGVIFANNLKDGGAFERLYCWTIDVADLTGDEAPDFLFGGHVCDYVSVGGWHYYGITRRKDGPGTMRIMPETWSTSITGRWEIANGVLQVGASDVFTAARGYELALQGGTLAMESNVTNSFAFFTALSSDSAIKLADGARLELPSAPTSWGSGVKLAVTLGEGAVLRIGTDDTALTDAQLRLIRVNGMRAKLDKDGSIKPHFIGLKIILR